MTDAAATIDAAATLEQLLDDRYSCRGFTSEPVPEETIDRIFRMAQRTASLCNSQAWQVELVTGQATAAFGFVEAYKAYVAPLSRGQEDAYYAEATLGAALATATRER